MIGDKPKRQKSTRVTIQDVADAARVSTAAVSKVVNITGSVGRATKRRVEAALHSTKWNPNLNGHKHAQTRGMLGKTQRSGDKHENEGRGAVSLTKRQLEVLGWIFKGKSNGQIAEILGISRHTVAAHRARMMKEMGVHKTAELVLYAIRRSLVSVS